MTTSVGCWAKSKGSRLFDLRLLTSSNSGTSNIPTVVLTNAYNADSQRTQQTATVSGTADFKNTWTYDNAGRLEDSSEQHPKADWNSIFRAAHSHSHQSDYHQIFLT
jgi:hypothetical protein